MTRRLRVALPALAFLSILVAACSAVSATPPPSGACVAADASNTVELKAQNLKFSAPCIEASAGAPIIIKFTNLESVPHNVTVYRDTSKSTELGHTETITGPDKTSTVTIPAQQPGQLFFDCTIHPSMNGALVVKAVPGASAS